MLSLPICVAFFVGSRLASENTWLTDLDKAKAVSAKTGRPILANFTGSDWCGWCIRLKEEVFDTVPFRRWADSKMVLLEVDFPETIVQPKSLVASNRQLAEKHKVTGFPSIVFLNSSGDEIARSGYLEQPGPWPWINFAEKLLSEGQADKE